MSAILQTLALYTAILAAALAVLWVARGWFDRWLDRRLVVEWGKDSDTPIYEATVKAMRYRPPAEDAS